MRGKKATDTKRTIPIIRYHLSLQSTRYNLKELEIIIIDIMSASTSTSTTTTTTTLAILAGTSSLASAQNSNIRASRPSVVAEAQDVNKIPSLGKECNTFDVETTLSSNTEWVSNEEKKAIDVQEEADVGILLVSCNDKDQSCTPDDSSSLGGRCITTADMINKNRSSYISGEEGTQPSASTEHSSIKETSRILLWSEGPGLTNNGPQLFCYCIQSFNDEFPSDGCANEVNQVCTNGDVLSEYNSECEITAEYGPYNQFISDVLCPYAECLVGSESKEECYCDFYRYVKANVEFM